MRGLFRLDIIFWLWWPLTTMAQSPLAPRGEPILYADAEHLGDLDDHTIHESSGLACSRCTDDLLWTHNDSGNQPILFALDLRGRRVGKCRVAKVRAIDWEDIASLQLDGKPYLLVGDFGDNQRRRNEVAIQLIAEPDLNETDVSVERTIRFRFADGSQDCEGMAYDPQSKTIFLVSKTWTPGCTIYELPSLFERHLDHESDDTSDDTLHVAQPIAKLPLAGTTGMDITSKGDRAIIVTYTDAFEFQRGEDESWRDAFARKPRHLIMPPRKQGESICYGQDDATLFLTSEKLPAPLFRISPRAIDSQEQRRMIAP